MGSALVRRKHTRREFLNLAAGSAAAVPGLSAVATAIWVQACKAKTDLKTVTLTTLSPREYGALTTPLFGFASARRFRGDSKSLQRVLAALAHDHAAVGRRVSFGRSQPASIRPVTDRPRATRLDLSSFGALPALFGIERALGTPSASAVWRSATEAVTSDATALATGVFDSNRILVSGVVSRSAASALEMLGAINAPATLPQVTADQLEQLGRRAFSGALEQARADDKFFSALSEHVPLDASAWITLPDVIKQGASQALNMLTGTPGLTDIKSFGGQLMKLAQDGSNQITDISNGLERLGTNAPPQLHAAIDDLTGLLAIGSGVSSVLSSLPGELGQACAVFKNAQAVFGKVADAAGRFALKELGSIASLIPVAGAIIGLFGGLFGGGRDPWVQQMLTQIDHKLDAIGAELQKVEQAETEIYDAVHQVFLELRAQTIELKDAINKVGAEVRAGTDTVVANQRAQMLADLQNEIANALTFLPRPALTPTETTLFVQSLSHIAGHATDTAASPIFAGQAPSASAPLDNFDPLVTLRDEPFAELHIAKLGLLGEALSVPIVSSSAVPNPVEWARGTAAYLEILTEASDATWAAIARNYPDPHKNPLRATTAMLVDRGNSVRECLRSASRRDVMQAASDRLARAVGTTSDSANPAPANAPNGLVNLISDTIRAWDAQQSIARPSYSLNPQPTSFPPAGKVIYCNGSATGDIFAPGSHYAIAGEDPLLRATALGVVVWRQKGRDFRILGLHPFDNTQWYGAEVGAYAIRMTEPSLPGYVGSYIASGSLLYVYRLLSGKLYPCGNAGPPVPIPRSTTCLIPSIPFPAPGIPASMGNLAQVIPLHLDQDENYATVLQPLFAQNGVILCWDPFGPSQNAGRDPTALLSTCADLVGWRSYNAMRHSTTGLGALLNRISTADARANEYDAIAPWAQLAGTIAQWRLSSDSRGPAQTHLRNGSYFSGLDGVKRRLDGILAGITDGTGGPYEPIISGALQPLLAADVGRLRQLSQTSDDSRSAFLVDEMLRRLTAFAELRDLLPPNAVPLART
jgi:hypothetical protein